MLAEISDMPYMFCRASAFSGNISDWDVGIVTNIESMFWWASAFNGSINGWVEI